MRKFVAIITALAATATLAGCESEQEEKLTLLQGLGNGEVVGDPVLPLPENHDNNDESLAQ